MSDDNDQNKETETVSESVTDEHETSEDNVPAGEDNSSADSSADDWTAAMEESGDADSDSSESDADGTAENNSGDDMGDDWAAAMEESGDADTGDTDDGIQQVQLDPVTEDNAVTQDSDEGPELDVILDIPVRISMEVGATQIPIRNLLQLNQGSVVELDRLAGEPLDVMVNGTLIAHGEVVMVNDKFGIRLTDVVSQSERIHRLR